MKFYTSLAAMTSAVLLGLSSPALGAESHSRLYKNFRNDSDAVLLGRLIFGEARNCSLLERKYVAYTALNRARDGKSWNGRSLREAILMPKQYSCFNFGDSNFKAIRDPLAFDGKRFYECLQIASQIITNKVPKALEGITHYHGKDKTVSWATNMKKANCPSSFKHDFYFEKKRAKKKKY